MEFVLDDFWTGREQQRRCGGEGGGGYCRGAAEARECSCVFSVHSGQK